MNSGKNRRILSGGQAVVETLKVEGVKHIFGLIGLATMELFDVIEFGIDDIVRSALVKDYIIAKYALGYA